MAVFSNPDKATATSGASMVPHTVSAVGASAQPGSEVFVSIELDSGGDEAAGSFTVNFDATKLSISNVSHPGQNPDVILGTGAPLGTALTINGNQVANGRIGVLFDSSNLFTAGPGRQIVRLRFVVSPAAPDGPTPITFGSTPTASSMATGLGEPITVSYIAGTVSIGNAAPNVTISGQVTKPNGTALANAQVVVLDPQGVRRLATTSTFGFYTVTDVPANQTYSVAVSSRSYRFTPVSALVVGTSDVTNVNFAGQE
ncbi:MAG: carboxypeptidase regulatory-like domain-containing protein [Pyrinomonadaceae bacterium]